jgi:hypothetical protein
MRFRIITLASAAALLAGTAQAQPNFANAPYIGNDTNIRSHPSACFNRSLTVTTTAQVAMPANYARMVWKIRNDSANIVWINFFTTATPTAGGGNIQVPVNSYIASEPGGVEAGAMSIVAAAGTASVTIVEC